MLSQLRKDAYNGLVETEIIDLDVHVPGRWWKGRSPRKTWALVVKTDFWGKSLCKALALDYAKW